MLDTSGFDTGLGLVDAGFDLLDSDLVSVVISQSQSECYGGMTTLLVERYSSE